MYGIFHRLFPKPKGNREHQEDLRQIAKGIVIRYTRGNVRLQQGKYMTQEDADGLKRAALRHKF